MCRAWTCSLTAMLSSSVPVSLPAALTVHNHIPLLISLTPLYRAPVLILARERASIRYLQRAFCDNRHLCEIYLALHTLATGHILALWQMMFHDSLQRLFTLRSRVMLSSMLLHSAVLLKSLTTYVNMCMDRLFVRDKAVLKSQVKENSKHPKWNEEFKFLVHEPEYQVCRLVLVVMLPSIVTHCKCFALRSNFGWHCMCIISLYYTSSASSAQIHLFCAVLVMT